VKWLRERDRGLAALRRAARAALVMPAMFALGEEVIGNPTVATFAAFGSFAMLLLVDFPGPMRARVQAQAALALTGAVFVCVGTLVSNSPWLAGTEQMAGWYRDFAASLTGGGEVPEPMERDDVADRRLVDAVDRDLRGEDGQATATAVRMIWTGDHLDAARRLQAMLAEPARTAVGEHALSGSSNRRR
jgi:hypothetical protein